MTPAAPGCLDGIRVVEIAEDWTAAAVCGRLLSELGAQVYQLEPLEGDRLRRRKPRCANNDSFAHRSLASNKRSICFDPVHDAAAGMVLDLLRGSDIALIDPDAVGGCGRFFGEKERERTNARLITAAFTAFGRDSSLAPQRGGDLVGQAMGGIIATTGHPGTLPHRAGAPLTAHASALFATTAILAALIEREESGLGQFIDAALYDAAVSTLYTFIPGYFISGKAPPPQGNRHPMSAPWDAFPARDGWVTVSMGDNRQWHNFLRLIARDDLIDSPRYRTHDERTQPGIRDEAEGYVAEYVRDKTVKEAVDALLARGIPAGTIVTVAQMLGDEHFKAREMAPMITADGSVPYRAVGSIFKMSETPGTVRAASPALGADTAAGLSVLCGYKPDRIEALRRAGAIVMRDA